jgi:hypothetical protein
LRKVKVAREVENDRLGRYGIRGSGKVARSLSPKRQDLGLTLFQRIESW